MTMPSEEDLDFAADIEAELDGALGKPQQEETQEEQEERLYRRDGRRFVPKEEEKAAKEEKADPAAKAEGAEHGAKTEQAPAAPKEKRPTWYKDEYGDWAKLPENFRNALREQERNAAQAIEKHSTAAKAWEPVSKLIEPHAQQLAAMGSSPQQYVTNLIQADAYLRQDPVQAINWLIGQYIGQGHDIRSLADWMDQEGVQSQKVDPVQQELAMLKQKLEHLERQPQEMAMAGLNKQIAEWSKDKPDFAAVKDIMAFYAKRNPEASLDDLYKEAQWAHPEIRERILAEREDKRLKDLQGKRQAGAQSPRGTPVPNGRARTSKRSGQWNVEADVAEALDELGLN